MITATTGATTTGLFDMAVADLLNTALDTLPCIIGATGGTGARAHAAAGARGSAVGGSRPGWAAPCVFALRLPSVIFSSSILFSLCMRPTIVSLLRGFTAG